MIADQLTSNNPSCQSLPADSYVVPFWVGYGFFSEGNMIYCPKRNYIGGTGYNYEL